MIREPSRDTSGRSNNRSTKKSAYLRSGPSQMPHRPMDTNQPGCEHAGAGRAIFRLRVDWRDAPVNSCSIYARKQCDVTLHVEASTGGHWTPEVKRLLGDGP